MVSFHITDGEVTVYDWSLLLAQIICSVPRAAHKHSASARHADRPWATATKSRN
jgi:hypothetical protein